MGDVVLSGQLICKDAGEVGLVERYLASHIALTRAESGCASFEVVRTSLDAMVWQVDERFVDVDAFEAHQRRVASSEWGRVTAHIERNYTIRGA
ncbi:antibiotic biosynthesis monooxygenase [Gordonia sp. ABSL1-1]|nr:antibiotic biosynthesis monooxygenase [Gordonia sp. ABSL1-1]MDL9935750.1 antibiotic biosynthesis monooxygenase [Gordonia sp. ABSL1-1]